jgi:flavin-dependent dehydrogenase
VADIAQEFALSNESLRLADGARVAVVGGGPSGSFFAYFLLQMAGRAGLSLDVDIYESRDFDRSGPAGCNGCGGIVSETLVQSLATEGINLPSTVVQRALDSYVLHMPEGDVFMDLPLQEKRIAALHRGGGPKGAKDHTWRGLDAFLLSAAENAGARVHSGRVTDLDWGDDKPRLFAKNMQEPATYDLVAGATGVGSSGAKLFSGLLPGFEGPPSTKAYVTELDVGEEWIETLGTAMQVFLLDIPRIEFGALIPKGRALTLVLLGEDVDDELIQRFLDAPQVRGCLPPNWELSSDRCRCSPRINLRGLAQPYADRVVLLGDCAVTRLYKDGIGASYRVAKSAAVTAVFEGVAATDFENHYKKTCDTILRDNQYGKVIFGISGIIQALKPTRRGVLGLIRSEQSRPSDPKRLTGVLWDTFSGSAAYRDIFFRTLHPAFIVRMLAHTARGLAPLPNEK